jgi:3'(2'), 5'-bisphosphate nucleotidase
MSNTFTQERKIAIHAVLKASHLCQEIRKKLVSEETIVKKDRSPVTIADFSSQTVISLALAKEFPNDPLVAEESSADLLGMDDDTVLTRVIESVQTIDSSLDRDCILTALDRGQYEGGASGRFWTLDPIDGTKGFLRGQQYAVSLALIENGEVVLGILGCPNYPSDWADENSSTGHLFIAVRGEGAFVRSMDNDQETQIHVSDITDSSQAVFCESVESGHSSHSDSEKIAELLSVTNPPLRLDSQCKYSAVARSDASIYLRLPTRADYQEKIWDHAGGLIVLEEAGGTVTDVMGNPLDFSLGTNLEEQPKVLSRPTGVYMTPLFRP